MLNWIRQALERVIHQEPYEKACNDLYQFADYRVVKGITKQGDKVYSYEFYLWNSNVPARWMMLEDSQVFSSAEEARQHAHALSKQLKEAHANEIKYWTVLVGDE